MSKQTDLINIPDAITVSGSNVGIGTTPSAGVQLNVGNSANNSAVSRVTNGTVSVDLTASGSGSVFLEVGTNHPLIFATNATERMRVLPSGGITFNGDTAAANALNDYEEGTFTPTVTVGTLGDAGGAYTKIGNTVIAYMYMGAFSNRSSGSILTINNLPFTSANALANGAGGSIFSRHCNKLPNATYVSNNSTNVEMYESATGNYDTVKHDDLNDVSAYFFIQVIYKTAS